MTGRYGRSQATAGRNIPRQVVQSFTRRVAHGEQSSRQHSSRANASVPASRFLPRTLCWLPSMMGYKL